MSSCRASSPTMRSVTFWTSGSRGTPAPIRDSSRGWTTGRSTSIPAKQRIAGPQHHTLSATQLTDVFDPGTFDLVLCNGVIGWGLNSPSDVEKGLDECADVMRPGAWLVVGWNDMEGRRVPGWTTCWPSVFAGRCSLRSERITTFLTRTTRTVSTSLSGVEIVNTQSSGQCRSSHRDGGDVLGALRR